MERRPLNVLVLMADHLRYDVLSCNGNKSIVTPNLDRLAQRSVRFHRAFANSPLCGPTRHTLATGMVPYRHGVVNNVMLPHEGMRTIAHLMRESDYRTHCFGHMHWQRLPGEQNDLFTDHGYERYGAMHAEIPSGKVKQRTWELLGMTCNTAAGPSVLTSDEGYGHQVARESIAQIRECVARGEKFLSWTSFSEPHPPFFPPKEFCSDIDHAAMPLPIGLTSDASSLHPAHLQRQSSWKHFSDWDHRRMKAGFYGLVRYADHCIGQVLDELDRQDLWKSTIVIFAVDHGEQLGDHGLYGKGVFREPSVHLPFMVCHPDLTPGDRTQLVEHVDVLPTICDLIGHPAPAGIDGHSLLPVLESAGASEVRDCVFSHLDCSAMVRTQRWKLVYYDGRPGELFDLESYPHEVNNLIEEPSAQAILGQLDGWLKATHPTAFEETRAILGSGRVRRPKVKPVLVMGETP